MAEAHWQRLDRYLERRGVRIGGPTLAGTTGGTHAAGSYHYSGRARDYGQSRADMRDVLDALLPYAAGSAYQVAELFGLDVFYKRGARISPSPGLRAQHQDHVHAALETGREEEFTRIWQAELGEERPVPDRIPPEHNPPLGPIAATWKDGEGRVIAQATPDGEVYAWAVPWRGNVKGKAYWGMRKVARIGPPVDPTKAYRVTSTSDEAYELPDDGWEATGQ